MRVVWGHRGTMSSEDSSVKKSELCLWAASVTSWMIYAPDVKRYLYADINLYNYLKDHRLLPFWDYVEILDFNNMLVPIPQMSAPKMLAWSLQVDEPFWGVDFDTYLMKKIPENFDYTKFAGEFYNPLGISLPIETYMSFKADQGLQKTHLRTLDARMQINTGFVYIPEPKIMSVIALAALENSRNFKRTHLAQYNGWAQEIAVANFLHRLDKEVVSIKEGTFFGHEYGGDKRIKDIRERVIQKLGYDPLEITGLDDESKLLV